MSDNDHPNQEEITSNFDSDGVFKDFNWVVSKIELLDQKVEKILSTMEVITDGKSK